MAGNGQVHPIHPGEAPTGKRAQSGARGAKSPITSAVLGPQTGAYGQVKGLFDSYAPLGYFMPWDILDYIELLATYNPDYSQAVDNVRTLANSGHELMVDAGSDLQKRKAKEYLETLAQTVQASHGGIDGLINKLLDQAATYGAMCGEWVLDDDLTTVLDFADINPKTIRFFWDEDIQQYAPYQKVALSVADARKRAGQEVRNGCIRLNPITFHYFAFDAEPESPYGTPPFVAALMNIGIQKDMIANMSQIVKKIGLLAMIDVSVEQLQPLPGESDEDFAARASAFLESYVDATEDMVRDGGLVHYNDVEVKTQSMAGNAAGATNIFKQNEELIFSGLKSMPSVQGRSYSTTETYAGVAYDIIIRNTKKYQQAVKRMIEAGYRLALDLQGLRVDSVKIQFNENKTLNRLQMAQSLAMEIKNELTLWASGITNQQDMAQRLGFADVKTEYTEPPESPLLENGGNSNTNDALGDDGGGKADNQNNRSASLDRTITDLEDPPDNS